MQSSNAKLHQDPEYLPITDPGHHSELSTKPMYSTFGLLQLNLLWTPKQHHKGNAENSKHVRSLSSKKRPNGTVRQECLASLHWLPIKHRIIFKLCTLTYKLLHNKGPKYLQELLHYKKPARTLRSSTDPYLLVSPKD